MSNDAQNYIESRYNVLWKILGIFVLVKVIMLTITVILLDIMSLYEIVYIIADMFILYNSIIEPSKLDQQQRCVPERHAERYS